MGVGSSGGFFRSTPLGHALPAGFSADGDNAVTSTTFGPTLGLGYEQPLSPKISVVPFFNVLVAPSGALRFNGDEVIDGVGFVLWQGGVGVTVH